MTDIETPDRLTVLYAINSALTLNGGSVRFSSIQSVFGIDNVAEYLIDCMEPNGVVITFSYAPIREGAVVKIENIPPFEPEQEK